MSHAPDLLKEAMAKNGETISALTDGPKAQGKGIMRLGLMRGTVRRKRYST